MRYLELVGYVASALVVLTFYMNDMVSLRVAALASNCAFLVYGVGFNLGPVIVLHGILLPLNVWRLAQRMGTGARLSAVDFLRRRLSGGTRR
jgi:CRP/FNR family transcriptional regulator, cyclic AMP receptor protein